MSSGTPSPPWGSDVLDPPDPTGFGEPSILSFPSTSVLLGVPCVEAAFGSLDSTVLLKRLESSLDDRGFAAVLPSTMDFTRAQAPPGYDPSSTLLLAERRIKTDRTWDRRFRRRALELFIGVAVVLIAMIVVLTLDPSLPIWVGLPFAVAFLVLLFGGIYAISNYEFWSEIICVIIRTEPPVVASRTPDGATSIRVWGGYGRSENWATKGAAGRNLKVLVRNAKLDSVIEEIIDGVQRPTESAPLA
jgi:hypothetical protein